MTIIDKLKLSKYQNMAVVNQPEDYDVFTNQPTEITKEHDAIFIFVETLDEIVKHTKAIIQHEPLTEKGYLFLLIRKGEQAIFNICSQG